jgi:type IV pilus assembly protein PilE
MKRIQEGFTLIEVMITVAIVGIAMAVAVPTYSDYVLRGRLNEAFTALGGAQPSAEQFWSNNRTYAGYDAATSFPTATPNFTYALSNATASTYTITAAGRAKASGFAYTINESGTRATTASPTGWGTNASCWVDRKGGACTE